MSRTIPAKIAFPHPSPGGQPQRVGKAWPKGWGAQIFGMTTDQLDIRSDHIVLRRDRVRVPIFDPQNLVGRGAIGELRYADQEIEILQSAKRFVEHRLERYVALHADRGRRLPQLPREQRPAEQFAIVDDRITGGRPRICATRAAGP